MGHTILQRQLNNRCVMFCLVFESTSNGRDRELSGVRDFSRTYKGILLWYDASGHLLVTKNGKVTDPLNHVTVFSKSAGRTFPSLSPDGTRIAFVQTENTSQDKKREGTAIWIVDVNRGIVDKVAVLPWVNALSWSPAGDKLAFTSDGLKILTLADKQITLINADMPSEAIPSWSPDGRQLAFESVSGVGDSQTFHVNIATLRSGEVKSIVEGRYPSWSPKGDQIAYLDSKEQAYFSVSSAGANRKLLVKAGYPAFKGPLLGMWFVWSPDQQQAIYNAYYDGGVEAVDVDLVAGRKQVIKQVGYFAAVDWRSSPSGS